MVTILMAVYNGEQYISEQIESILAQTYTQWQLIICDDCSTDGSYNIAETYAQKYPDRIFLQKNSVPTGSAQNNFMQMLNNADSDYIMFADQDDVWLRDKISVTLAEMKRLESLYSDIPLLVHTELEVVDNKLNTISKSFTKYAGFNAKYNSLNRLLVQNNITGCTMMINRKLANMANNTLHTNIIMHDWWLGLIAAAFGYIGFVTTPTIQYRQHGANQVGAKNAMSIKQLISSLGRKLSGKSLNHLTFVQAKYLYRIYADNMPHNTLYVLEEYISIPQKNKLRRISCILKHRFLRQRFIHALGQIIFC